MSDTINGAIMQALTPVGLPIGADSTQDPGTIYLAFNFDRQPVHFGDGAPEYNKALVQVHLYGPARRDLLTYREQIMSCLFSAGFTAPAEYNNSEPQQQHYTYECEILEAAGYGEP